MNTAAWQPSRTGPGSGKSRLNSKDKAAGAGNDADMAESALVPKPLRVLVSEGSSTSAREAITILGLSGHRVEVCDPNPYALARFSRFVESFIAARDYGTIQPDISPLSKSCWRRGTSMCCCRSMNRDFCWRG
jgi:hypothetical protein